MDYFRKTKIKVQTRNIWSNCNWWQLNKFYPCISEYAPPLSIIPVRHIVQDPIISLHTKSSKLFKSYIGITFYLVCLVGSFRVICLGSFHKKTAGVWNGMGMLRMVTSTQRFSCLPICILHNCFYPIIRRLSYSGKSFHLMSLYIMEYGIISRKKSFKKIFAWFKF